MPIRKSDIFNPPPYLGPKNQTFKWEDGRAVPVTFAPDFVSRDPDNPPFTGLARRGMTGENEINALGTNLTRQYKRGLIYQDQQIASLAAPGGALTPTRMGTPEGTMANLSPVSPSLADTSFFPDQEIYTNPGAFDVGTSGAYQNRVNIFKRDFLQKAAMRKSNFTSVEEFKAFVENNPNYSPEIGTAAWDFAQSQLQRANPGLFQRITAQDKTMEANNLSKLQWMEQALPNVAPDMTAEQKIRYINANPELLQGWQQDATAAKYRMNPATNQLEQIPPSPEQAYEIERRKTGQYFTEEEKMEMAAMGVPIIQTPAGLLAPGDKNYKMYVKEVPIKQEDPTTGKEKTTGYEYMPFKGVKTYQPEGMESPEVKARQDQALQLGMKALQNPKLSVAGRQAIQAEIDAISAPLVTSPSQVTPPTPVAPRGIGEITDAYGEILAETRTTPVVQRGQGIITGTGGQVLASRGITKPAIPSPVVQPKAVSTPPVITPALGQPEEQRRQEIRREVAEKEFSDFDFEDFVTRKAKDAGMTISDWANFAIQGLYGLGNLASKGAELVGKGVVGIPRTTIKTAEHLRTYIPTRLYSAFQDMMREEEIEKRLAKETRK